MTITSAFILGASLGVAWHPGNHLSAPTNKPLAARPVSCHSPEITFNYPVSAGFEKATIVSDDLRSTGEFECKIVFGALSGGTPSTDALPAIVAGSVIKDDLPFNTKNPYGVPYRIDPSGGGYWFRVGFRTISINLFNFPLGSSFDKEVFWQIVINSFHIEARHNHPVVIPYGQTATLEEDPRFSLAYSGARDYDPQNPGIEPGELVTVKYENESKTFLVSGFGSTSFVFKNYKVVYIPKLRTRKSPILIKIERRD